MKTAISDSTFFGFGSKKLARCSWALLLFSFFFLSFLNNNYLLFSSLTFLAFAVQTTLPTTIYVSDFDLQLSSLSLIIPYILISIWMTIQLCSCPGAVFHLNVIIRTQLHTWVVVVTSKRSVLWIPFLW